MLTIYYYPEADLDSWYLFQVIDSKQPLLVQHTDDFVYWNDATSEETNEEDLQYELDRIYDIPNGVFNPAVTCIQTESLDTLRVSHPEFFI